jgi:hypothetical protein
MSRGQAEDCLYACDQCGSVYLRVPWDYDRERCPRCCQESGFALAPAPAEGFSCLGECVTTILGRTAAIAAARRRIHGSDDEGGTP